MKDSFTEYRILDWPFFEYFISLKLFLTRRSRLIFVLYNLSFPFVAFKIFSLSLILSSLCFLVSFLQVSFSWPHKLIEYMSL
jgi:hypothetical protein